MRTRFHYRLLAVAALLLFFALALNTAGQEAITTDEPLHLARGIAMRQTGYLSLSDKHVPLIYRLVSLALLTEDDLPQMSRFAAWGAGSPYAIGQELVTTTGCPSTGPSGSAAPSLCCWALCWGRCWPPGRGR